ncbi:MAG: DoxX family membrane protein [Daejeonella sp.]|uniref:DoxX family membrane protein n=1 Tax=Daejeonella sp. JGW-45 TaxID=3034148 RepID=UPI0023ED1DBE|nr:DoxX family membrane protein [Daejeonella sp. JGW-45]
MKIVKLVLYILFGLMFVNAGLNKFLNYMPMPELTPVQIKFFTAFASISWMIPLIAVIEIIGGILVMIPKTRALGAIVILPVMVGILVHHATIDTSGLVIALVLMAINVLAIADNWGKYQALIRD